MQIENLSWSHLYLSQVKSILFILYIVNSHVPWRFRSGGVKKAFLVLLLLTLWEMPDICSRISLAFTSPVWKHPLDNNTGYECVYSKQESLCACVKCKHEICKLIILSALKLFFVSWTKVAETGVYLSAGDTNCGKNIISIKYVLG